ncbi:MAG: CHAT domain-containing protein [Saprospiraceae bacterium]|nr:CHAT domain-containing protein [Saprospiraceae bacterium]
MNGLYTVAERGARPLGKPQKSLYELLWLPLEKSLPGVQTIYFSPSGLLHRLNIGAIPVSEEESIADRYRLVEVGSTRQLVIPTEVKIGSQDAPWFLAEYSTKWTAPPSPLLMPTSPTKKWPAGVA